MFGAGGEGEEEEERETGERERGERETGEREKGRAAHGRESPFAGGCIQIIRAAQKRKTGEARRQGYIVSFVVKKPFYNELKSAD